MSSFKLMPVEGEEIDDNLLRQFTKAWVDQVCAALRRAGGGTPRIEMRSVSDGEKPVEIVLEYVLE